MDKPTEDVPPFLRFIVDKVRNQMLQEQLAIDREQELSDDENLPISEA